MDDERIEACASAVFPREEVSAQPLKGDGSSRTFVRLSSGGKSALCVLPDRTTLWGRNENLAYAYIAGHLARAGVRVPEVLFFHEESAACVVEDLGDVRLYDAARNRDEAGLLGFYLDAIENLVKVQAVGVHGFDTSFCFDTRVYDAPFIYERELLYFEHAFLKGRLGLEFDSDRLQSEFGRLSERGAYHGEGFLMHRDFQSRNLMVKEGRVFVIDFQGARLGPPQYDLASLILDPYADLSRELRERLFSEYIKALDEMVYLDEAAFREKYPYVALCRTLQALAAFAFLSGVRKRPGFEEHIPAGLKNLGELLKGDLGEEFPYLAELAGKIET